MPDDNSSSPRSNPNVSPAEWEVMRVLWDNGPMAARDVYTALPSDRGWAMKTVKTLLSRLVAKGALEYDQIGNSYLYRATCTRDDVQREEVRGFVSRVLEGSLAPVLAHFIEERGLTDDDIKALRDVLNQAGKKGGKAK